MLRSAGCVLVLLALPALTRAQPVTASVCDVIWHDSARDRTIPVRLRIPNRTELVPLLLFSHGLGGSVEGGTAWGEHWAAHGFAVVHVQHPGSDNTTAALRAAMNARETVARALDVTFVLDQLVGRRVAGRCDVARIDLERVGMSGHSFGARTTQLVAGQKLGRQSLRDPRIDAAIAFSPGPPRTGVDAAFADVEIPFFSITGTADAVPVLNDVSPEQRLQVYAAMPPGGKYLLVFDGGDHDDFGGNTGRGTRRRRPNEHVATVVKAATLAFWRATLLEDAEARAWLEGAGLQTLLAAGDRFEHK